MRGEDKPVVVAKCPLGNLPATRLFQLMNNLKPDSTHKHESGQGSLVMFDEPHAVSKLADVLRVAIDSSPEQSINLFAIGSDRTTGDCLGPLVGEFLSGTPLINVYGTLDAPIHAANMAEIVPEITGFTIAVDAALGSPVGGISVRSGPLAPGAAFGQKLPDVGNVSISGFVCEAGPLGFERLRSVRLGFVRNVARTISSALMIAIESGRMAQDRDAGLLDLTAYESSWIGPDMLSSSRI